MGILQYVEQTERIALLMPRIEEDDLIPGGIVVFLIPSEEHVGPQIREHLAYAMDEYVGLVVAIVQGHVGFNLVVHKTDEVVGVRLRSQLRGHHVGMELVALERVFQQRRVAELLILEILAEHAEQVKLQGVDKVGGTFQLLLELLYLPAHLVFLVGRILVYVIVVEDVAALFVEEQRRTKILIQLFYGHSLHDKWDLISLISYGYRKQASKNHSSPVWM